MKFLWNFKHETEIWHCKHNRQILSKSIKKYLNLNNVLDFVIVNNKNARSMLFDLVLVGVSVVKSESFQQINVELFCFAFFCFVLFFIYLYIFLVCVLCFTLSMFFDTGKDSINFYWKVLWFEVDFERSLLTVDVKEISRTNYSGDW